jgi:rod shape-determining protein MreD
MFGIVNTLVGYFAASVGLRLDVDHTLIRFLLCLFFYLFHQVFYWVLARALLGQQAALAWGQMVVLGLLNAVIGAALFHFLDRLRERV